MLKLDGATSIVLTYVSCNLVKASFFTFLHGEMARREHLFLQIHRANFSRTPAQYNSQMSHVIVSRSQTRQIWIIELKRIYMMRKLSCYRFIGSLNSVDLSICACLVVHLSTDLKLWVFGKCLKTETWTIPIKFQKKNFLKSSSVRISGNFCIKDHCIKWNFSKCIEQLVSFYYKNHNFLKKQLNTKI